MSKKWKVAMTYGTFDLLHTGHINLLNRIKDQSDKLVVFVSSDNLNDWKGKQSFIPESIRLAVVSNLKMVDDVFIELDMNGKQNDIEIVKIKYDLKDEDIALFVGEEWPDSYYDYLTGVNVVKTERTKGISSTDIKNRIISIVGATNES